MVERLSRAMKRLEEEVNKAKEEDRKNKELARKLKAEAAQKMKNERKAKDDELKKMAEALQEERRAKEEERRAKEEERRAKEEERKAKERALRDVAKERKEKEVQKQRADILQDDLFRQGARQNRDRIPQVTKQPQLVHKPDNFPFMGVPCMFSSTARDEGTFCMCTVKEHWHWEEVDCIVIGPNESETDEIIHKDDVLGGQDTDIPDDVHALMVDLAIKGEIPITTPSQRRFLARKRRTYQGDDFWKLPVKYGYLHPTLRAPKGFFWKMQMWQCGICPISKTSHRSVTT